MSKEKIDWEVHDKARKTIENIINYPMSQWLELITFFNQKGLYSFHKDNLYLSEEDYRNNLGSFPQKLTYKILHNKLSVEEAISKFRKKYGSPDQEIKNKKDSIIDIL